MVLWSHAVEGAAGASAADAAAAPHDMLVRLTAGMRHTTDAIFLLEILPETTVLPPVQVARLAVPVVLCRIAAGAKDSSSLEYGICGARCCLTADMEFLMLPQFQLQACGISATPRVTALA